MHHSADPGEPDPNFVKWLKDNCVPIAGIVFGALVLCLAAHYSSTTVDWTRTKEFTDAFANVTQSLALLAGRRLGLLQICKRAYFSRQINTYRKRQVCFD